LSDNHRPADGAWTMDQLLAAEAAGERMKYLPFWGHTPPPDGRIGPHVLSQWFLHPFEWVGTTHQSHDHPSGAAATSSASRSCKRVRFSRGRRGRVGS